LCLSTPFWEFLDLIRKHAYEEELYIFLLPFGSFRINVNTVVANDLVLTQNLSTPFWEFLAENEYDVDKPTIVLSTPFWEFQDDLLYKYIPSESTKSLSTPFWEFRGRDTQPRLGDLKVCRLDFLLPFGSFS
jgi:hypothetical protein